MLPRTILYTGKGGVGKTSVAAHSLSESLESDLGAEPSQVADRVWGQEVKAQEEMERHWSGVQDWLGELFVERGLDRISAEELTVPPGAL